MRTATALLVTACALALAATAGASVQHLSFPLDATFQDDLTEVCGFDVFMRIEGTARVGLTVDDEGEVLREMDTVSGTITYFSATGSFSLPPASRIFYDYGAGAQVGSTATIKLVGLIGHVPGFLASDAGIIIATGTVVGFGDFGIPIVAFDGPISFEHGHFHDQDRIDATICAALS
jgi:hypothetical protein